MHRPRFSIAALLGGTALFFAGVVVGLTLHPFIPSTTHLAANQPTPPVLPASDS